MAIIMQTQRETDLENLLASDQTISWLRTRTGGKPHEFSEQAARAMISSIARLETTSDEWLRASLECLQDQRMFGYSTDTLARYLRCSNELLDELASDPAKASIRDKYRIIGPLARLVATLNGVY